MTFLAEIALALIVAAAVPAADPLPHAGAALAAAGDDLPVEVVLAIAWYESGLTAPPISPGQRADCGPMQVNSNYVQATCAELCVLDVGYSAGADVLRRWLRHAGGRWREAVQGYRCGWEGLRGPCSIDPTYADRVLRLAQRLGWTGMEARPNS